MPSREIVVLLLACAACHSSPAAVTVTPTVAHGSDPANESSIDASAARTTPASVDGEAPALDAARPGVDAGTTVTADASRVSPREALVRAIVAGTTPLADAIDPAHGVTVIRHIEALPNGHPAQISNQHYCGAALTRALPVLRRNLAEVIEQAGDSDGFDCNETECSVAGMEYQPAWHLRFVSVDGGGPRIAAIAQVSEAAISEEWLERARAYVERSLATARSHPCGPR